MYVLCLLYSIYKYVHRYVNLQIHNLYSHGPRWGHPYFSRPRRDIGTRLASPTDLQSLQLRQLAAKIISMHSLFLYVYIDT